MAAITGLDIVYGKDASAPCGYTLIKEDLNKGAGGEYVYLCYSTLPDLGPSITAIQVGYASCSQDHRTEFTVIDKDLSKGAGGKYIYVSYASGTTTMPITAIEVISGDDYNIWPSKEFIKIGQDCNQGSGGDYIFVCYKF